MNQFLITPDIIEELQKAFFNIPFENSQFQTEHFVIEASITPERAYRAIGLRMMNRIRALQEAQFARRREEVELDEIDQKIFQIDSEIPSRDGANVFKKRRLQIDREEILARRPFTDKLINDAITELNILYSHFQALPKFTREEFEAGEYAYFKESLTRQAEGVVGPFEALLNLNNERGVLKCLTKKDH